MTHPQPRKYYEVVVHFGSVTVEVEASSQEEADQIGVEFAMDNLMVNDVEVYEVEND